MRSSTELPAWYVRESGDGEDELNASVMFTTDVISIGARRIEQDGELIGLARATVIGDFGTRWGGSSRRGLEVGDVGRLEDVSIGSWIIITECELDLRIPKANTRMDHLTHCQPTLR